MAVRIAVNRTTLKTKRRTVGISRSSVAGVLLRCKQSDTAEKAKQQTRCIGYRKKGLILLGCVQASDKKHKSVPGLSACLSTVNVKHPNLYSVMIARDIGERFARYSASAESGVLGVARRTCSGAGRLYEVEVERTIVLMRCLLCVLRSDRKLVLLLFGFLRKSNAHDLLQQ